jgi:phosphoribosyl-ATP pyrophosphohydrolase
MSGPERPGFTLADLEAIVARRASAPAEESWTARLLASGLERVAKKFGEEAVEAVIAAIGEDRAALRNEAADVLFHLLVLLKAREIALDDVMTELARRTGQSGLAEKASRPAQ